MNPFTHSNSTRSTNLIAAALAGGVALGAAGSAHAQFAVNLTADATDFIVGDCGVDVSPGIGGAQITLRAAVQEANVCPGPNVITLPPGTYTLTIGGPAEDLAARGDLDVFGGSLLIRAATPGTVVIDGNGLDRIFDVAPGAELILDGITLRNGDSGAGGTMHGGAIRSGSAEGSATLFLQDCVLEDNLAQVPGVLGGSGGAIYATGFVGIERTRFESNEAESSGGAIFMTPGSTIDVDDSTFEGNFAASSGGAIMVNGDGSSTTIDRALFEGNAAIGGGGISLSGQSVVRRSTFRSNEATDVSGGAMRLRGSVEIDRCEITLNTAEIGGGGIFGDSTANLRIVRSSLNRNGAERGGALSLHGDAEIVNTTFAANEALDLGSAIHVDHGGSIEASFVTVAHNGGSGPAIVVGDAGAATFATRASVYGSNVGANIQVGGAGTFDAVEANVRDDFSGGFDPMDSFVVDVELAPPSLGGEATTSCRPLASSPVIDRVLVANDLNGVPVSIDQIGESRPLDGNGDLFAFADAGAREYVVPCLGDCNGDGVIDGADLASLLAAWDTSSSCHDLDESGTVDGADLAMLLAAWGACP